MSDYLPELTISSAYEALSPGRDWSKFRAAMRVSCPWCRARAGQPCVTGGIPLTQGDRIHPARAAKSAPGATDA